MVRLSTGDFDYDAQGQGYARQRRADPRIAALVHAALGPARTVLNVGAGAGSYEPEDRHVIAIEPSPAMRAQRPAHLSPAIHGIAEKLPLNDRSVDAAMALVTIHQWGDLEAGLAELVRVTRGPIVVMTFDSDAMDRFWLMDYAPEVFVHERRRMPAIDRICAGLGGGCEVITVPVPLDCTDGFNEAYYGRPERFLDSAVRKSQSAWGFVAPEVEERIVATLAADLASGAWDARHGHLRTQPWFEGAVRLIVRP
jgi:SAM-dependent methyltransferase